MSGSNTPLPFDKSNEEHEVGDSDWEIPFFEGIVADCPNNCEALAALGNLYTQRGDCAKGLEIDNRLAKLQPCDPIVRYNLACSLSLLDDVDAALAELEKAIALGYNDCAYMLQDKDLENLRSDPRFSQLMKRFSKTV